MFIYKDPRFIVKFDTYSRVGQVSDLYCLSQQSFEDFGMGAIAFEDPNIVPSYILKIIKYIVNK
jgi:hypothetical protein